MEWDAYISLPKCNSTAAVICQLQPFSWCNYVQKMAPSRLVARLLPSCRRCDTSWGGVWGTTLTEGSQIHRLLHISCSVKLAGSSISTHHTYPDMISNVWVMADVSLCLAPRVKLYISLAYHQHMSRREKREERDRYHQHMSRREKRETDNKTS